MYNIITDFKIFEAKQIPFYPPKIENTMNFWHGGNLDEYKQSISHKKGRFEYGAGLYLTDSYEVVQKYAKGNRKLYLITVEKGNEINDCYLDYNNCIKFVNEYVIKNKKALLLSRLEPHFKDNKIDASVFNNMILNTEAIRASDTEYLRDFLLDNDIDYELTGNIGGWHGNMMILYNMSKIVETKQITKYDKIMEFELKNNYK